MGLSLGWQDVRDTYQRSTLGPLWITLALAIQVASIGLVFGLLFGADLSQFFPFLAISLVLWNFIVTGINDATDAYVKSQQIMKQMRVPSFFPVIRVMAKNIIIFAHNLVIIAIVAAIFGVRPGWSLVLFIPGLVVVVGVLYFVSTIAATISARFRDVPPIVSAVLMVSFYLTPVIWMPNTLPEPARSVVLTINPLFHLMELVRGPILGEPPTGLNWLVGLGLLIVTYVAAQWVSKKFFWKVVYWL